MSGISFQRLARPSLVYWDPPAYDLIMLDASAVAEYPIELPSDNHHLVVAELRNSDMLGLVAVRVSQVACIRGASVHFGVPCLHDLTGVVSVGVWSLQVSRRYSNLLHHSRHCQQAPERLSRPICVSRCE